jgi:hypothetical protein
MSDAAAKTGERFSRSSRRPNPDRLWVVYDAGDAAPSVVVVRAPKELP